MPKLPHFPSLGGRLAIDFANLMTSRQELQWDELIGFLGFSSIVSAERATQLLRLPQVDSRAADELLTKATHLALGLRSLFSAMTRSQKTPREAIQSVNLILRITEGHDELVPGPGGWRLEFMAREGGLDWLLAAIARSGAEIVSEGVAARIRKCSNPSCGLFFYDNSRTRQRRWCSMATCGNRHKVAAFARRRSTGAR